MSETRALAVASDLTAAATAFRTARGSHTREIVQVDDAGLMRLSAEVDDIKRRLDLTNDLRAVLTELPEALSALTDRIGAIERSIVKVDERLRTIETGWLPFEETMRQHASRTA